MNEAAVHPMKSDNFITVYGTVQRWLIFAIYLLEFSNIFIIWQIQMIQINLEKSVHITMRMLAKTTATTPISVLRTKETHMILEMMHMNS